jgi:four helix bundle protein
MGQGHGRAGMQRFKDIRVWQQGHALAMEVYRRTEQFPKAEFFGGIGNQLRRAIVSVPTNIAEGSKRKSPREYARFLNIAEASLVESEYLVILSCDLGYLTTDAADAMNKRINELSRQIHALRRAVEKGEDEPWTQSRTTRLP